MKKVSVMKFKQLLLCFLIVAVVVFQMPASNFAGLIAGNPDGKNPIPPEARAADVSKPDHIIGTGTPESCTAEAFIKAVAQGEPLFLTEETNLLPLP